MLDTLITVMHTVKHNMLKVNSLQNKSHQTCIFQKKAKKAAIFSKKRDEIMLAFHSFPSSVLHSERKRAGHSVPSIDVSFCTDTLFLTILQFCTESVSELGTRFRYNTTFKWRENAYFDNESNIIFDNEPVKHNIASTKCVIYAQL